MFKRAAGHFIEFAFNIAERLAPTWAIPILAYLTSPEAFNERNSPAIGPFPRPRRRVHVLRVGPGSATDRHRAIPLSSRFAGHSDAQPAGDEGRAGDHRHLHPR